MDPVLESILVVFETAVIWIISMVVLHMYYRPTAKRVFLNAVAFAIVTGAAQVFGMWTIWPFVANIAAAVLCANLLLFIWRNAPNENLIPKSAAAYMTLLMIVAGLILHVRDEIDLGPILMVGIAIQIVLVLVGRKIPSRGDIVIFAIGLLTWGFATEHSSEFLLYHFGNPAQTAITIGNLLISATMLFLLFAGFRYWRINLHSSD